MKPAIVSNLTVKEQCKSCKTIPWCHHLQLSKVGVGLSYGVTCSPTRKTRVWLWSILPRTSYSNSLSFLNPHADKNPFEEVKFMYPLDWQYNLVCDGEFTVEEDREVVVNLGDRAVEHKIKHLGKDCLNMLESQTRVRHILYFHLLGLLFGTRKANFQWPERMSQFWNVPSIPSTFVYTRSGGSRGFIPLLFGTSWKASWSTKEGANPGGAQKSDRSVCIFFNFFLFFFLKIVKLGRLVLCRSSSSISASQI